MGVHIVFGVSRFSPGEDSEVKTNRLGSVQDLISDFTKVFKGTSFYVLCNGKKLDGNTCLEDGQTYHVIPRLVGGKGGFGSMLRAIGAQIEKTTSREACRDLSGRRMRDINNEKKLKEWLSKEADREREKEERRQERLARRHAQPQHKFDDPEYHEQRAKVQENLQDALNKGLKRAHTKGTELEASSSKKTKTVKLSSKRKAEWIGMDIGSDDLDSDSDTEANPGEPQASSSQTDIHRETTASVRGENCNGKSHNSSTSSSPCSSMQVEKQSDMPSKLSQQTSEDSKSEHSLLSRLPPPVNESSCGVDKNYIPSDTPVDLTDFASSEELAQIGLERLKNALMHRGLKCGGTLEERAERLFSVKGLAPEDIDPSLYAKSKGKGKKSKV